MKNIHYNITVTGIVQGVGFRYSVVRIARNLGIKGFVRNQTNGSVYIEAEGTPVQLDKFIAWCYQGPPSARVDRIDYEESAFKSLLGFDVKY